MSWLHAVIDVPAAQWARANAFWTQALGWPTGTPWPAHPELCSFEPPDGSPYVHLQEVDGPAARVHLDIETADRDALAATVVAGGARQVGATAAWDTFTSPGGLPFCLVREGGGRSPTPVTWPDGHRTRLVQVCVDSPAPLHDDEVAFWRSVLDGRWVDSPAPEFAGKWHDDAGSPLQLLFQRLEETDGPVRAHLDLGTDRPHTEVARLESLGAEHAGDGDGWQVLRDPLGLAFCVTRNDPRAGIHRDLG